MSDMVPSVALMRYTDNPDEICGMSAAVCTAAINPRLSLKHSLESRHESVVEHASFTFLIQGVSRAFLAQFTRHRLASFSVQSQRYVAIDGDMDYIIPPSIKDLGEEAVGRYEHQMKKIENWYKEWRSAGVKPEDARYVLPNAAETCLMVTMNCRELLHFFELRCCNRAQWQIREVAEQMLHICREKAPEIFKNAGPGCVRGSCPETRPCGQPRLDLKEE